MKKPSFLRRFSANEAGATIVEFVIVFSAFLTIMMSVIEYGMFMMTQVALEGLVSQAGREASVTRGGGTGCAPSDRPCAVRRYIEDKSQGLINHTGIAINTVNLTAMAGGPTGGQNTMANARFAGDLCLMNPPHIGGRCPMGTPWQAMPGRAASTQYLFQSGPGSFNTGNAGDLIELNVQYPWKPLTPFSKMLFNLSSNRLKVITARTIVRNE